LDLLSIATTAQQAGRIDVVTRALSCNLHPEIHAPEYPDVADHEQWVFIARLFVERGEYEHAIPALEHIGSKGPPVGVPRRRSQELVDLSGKHLDALRARETEVRDAIRRLEDYLSKPHR
jgi:hypothetical protein